MRHIVVIAHDLRSSHNVGSLLRTCDGLGVATVYLTGYSPYPAAADDRRLPHIRRKLDTAIHKTALGAERTQRWRYCPDVTTVLAELRRQGYLLAALEQLPGAIALPDFSPPDKLALLVGREVEGIDSALLDRCDVALEIPMFGSKESFNVVQAAAMALYACRVAP